MEKYSLDSESASIVLVGSFNPAIFHPEWLLRHELISEDDWKGKKEDIEIIHPEIAKFALEWLYFDVVRNKLIVRTNDSSKYLALRDLMVSVLKILEHTPIDFLGMNFDLRFKIDEEKFWHRIGDNLVPKNYWDTLPDRVGMKVVTVESPRPDDLKGYIQVKVTPITGDFKGVHFNVNNHVVIKYNEDDKDISLNAGDILFEHWERLLEYSRNVCIETLKKVIKI